MLKKIFFAFKIKQNIKKLKKNTNKTIIYL